MTAIPDEGYSFYGWQINENEFEGVNEKAYDYQPNKNATVTALFRLTSSDSQPALFGVGTKRFTDLNLAINEAGENSINIISVKDSGTIPSGSFAIPSGITLLVPFDTAETIYTKIPENSRNANETAKAFRTLILCENVSLTFESGSSLCIPSKTYAAGGSEMNGGSPIGNHGRIDMLDNSKITMESGSSLYCWGYIAGSGVVEAKAGSKVYECFQIEDFRGGTVSTSLPSGVFPFSQYYIANIETRLLVRSGAEEFASTALYALSSIYPSNEIPIIGESGLFSVTGESAYIEKYYDVSEDKLVINFYGSDDGLSAGAFEINPLKVKLAGSSVDSANYILPIHAGINIGLKNKASLKLNQNISLYPGLKFSIDLGCTFNISDGKALYLYDLNDCKDYMKSGLNNRQLSYVAGAPSNKPISRDDAYFENGGIDVNGTLNIQSGSKLYTSTSGANIYSSGGNGIINFANLSESVAEINCLSSVASTDNLSENYKTISVINASLKNGEGVNPQYVSTNINSRGSISFNYNSDHWERDGLLAEEITITFKESKDSDSKEHTVVYKKESGGCYTLPGNDFGFASGDLKLRRWVLENNDGDSTVSVYKPGETDNGDFGSNDIVLYPYWGGEWLKVKNSSDINYNYLYIHATLDEIETPASGIETMAAPDSTDSSTKLLFNDEGIWQRTYFSKLSGLYQNNKDGGRSHYYVTGGIVDETTGVKELGSTSGMQYCYVGNEGYVLTNTRKYISGSTLLPDGFYNIGATGIIHYEDPSTISGDKAYYSDGTLAIGHGLFINNGHYYYAKEDGTIVKSTSSQEYATFYVSKTNNKQYDGSDVKAGLYCFDSNGYMLDPTTLKPMEAAS